MAMARLGREHPRLSMMVMTLGVLGGGVGVTADALAQHQLSPGALVALWTGSALAGVAHQIYRWRTRKLFVADSQDSFSSAGLLAIALLAFGVAIGTGAPLVTLIVPLFGGFTVAYLPYLWWVILVIRPAERRE
jgi:hypothetical protein